MGGLDVINILDGLDGLLKKTSWMDGLDVINILDGLDGCPSDGMDWMLDGLLTTLVSCYLCANICHRTTQRSGFGGTSQNASEMKSVQRR